MESHEKSGKETEWYWGIQDTKYILKLATSFYSLLLDTSPVFDTAVLATKSVNCLLPRRPSYHPSTSPANQVTGVGDSGLSLPYWIINKGEASSSSLSFLRA